MTELGPHFGKCFRTILRIKKTAQFLLKLKLLKLCLVYLEFSSFFFLMYFCQSITKFEYYSLVTDELKILIVAMIHTTAIKTKLKQNV